MGLMMSDEVVKTTNISYCAECHKDFADNETCNSKRWGSDTLSMAFL